MSRVLRRVHAALCSGPLSNSCTSPWRRSCTRTPRQRSRKRLSTLCFLHSRSTFKHPHAIVYPTRLLSGQREGNVGESQTLTQYLSSSPIICAGAVSIVFLYTIHEQVVVAVNSYLERTSRRTGWCVSPRPSQTDMRVLSIFADFRLVRKLQIRM